LEVIRRLRELGVPAISIGDTLGAAFPHQVDRLLEMVQAELGIEGIALHLHDTYRRALANALVGLQHGVEELDASAGGLGGCPFAPGARGNVATEELVAFLEGMGVATGVDVVKVQSASAALRAALNDPRSGVHPLENRLLDVQAVLCFLKNHGLLRVDHVIGHDDVPPDGRQCMKYARRVRSMSRESTIHSLWDRRAFSSASGSL
jgi:pyruvate/oxaloacetate carboxyltransferase